MADMSASLWSILPSAGGVLLSGSAKAALVMYERSVESAEAALVDHWFKSLPSEGTQPVPTSLVTWCFGAKGRCRKL